MITAPNKVPPYIGAGIGFGDIDYIYRAGNFENSLNSVGNPLRRWHSTVGRNFKVIDTIKIYQIGKILRVNKGF